MNTHSPNKLARIYQCAHQVSSFLLVFYVFIFNKNNISDAHIRRIRQTQSEKKSHIVPFGYSVKDYKEIESAVLGDSKEQKPKVKLILVADVQNCEIILKMKKEKGTLNDLHEVYACYQEKDYRSQKLLQDYDIINKDDHNIEALINTAERIFKQLKEKPAILRNFCRLDDQKEERRLYLMKIRANGAINLKEKQYDSYYEKFKTYLEEFLLNRKSQQNSREQDILSSSNLAKEIQIKLERAIQLLKQKKEQQFKQEMLSLYQDESVFYEVINTSLMKFSEKDFPWQCLALPFCLLYKAVKLEFHEKYTLDEIFGNKNYVILYRAGKISKEEYKQMINALSDKPFFQMSSFLSTSMKRSVAYKFLDKNDPQTNCLMEIHLKRPETKQEIQNFSFVYQSFAKLPNAKKGGVEVNQFQVLLNALSVGRLVDIKKIKYRDIKNKSKELTDKFKHVFSSQSIPVLSFQMGNFQNFLKGFTKQGISKMSAMQQRIAENYLVAIDSIKNVQKFDIGHSLQLSGQLKEAHQYNLQKLNSLQQEDVPEGNQAELLEKKKHYHQVCYRLSQTSFDLGMEQETLNYIEISIQTYKMVKQLDKNRTKKQHNRYLKKMYQQASGMLIAYKRSGQAKNRITNYIQQLGKKAASEKGREIYFQFRIAEYLLDLGIINFEEGQIKKALAKIQESELMIKNIKQEIQYETLKNESFYLTFIFACIFSEKKWKNKEDYFEQKRAYNIAQAAHIVGAQEKFNDIMRKTNVLKENMIQFIEEQQTAEITISQIGCTINSQEKQRIDVNMLKKIQYQFEDHTLVEQLKPAFQDFFTSFKSSLQTAEDEQKNGIDQKYKNLVEKVVIAANKKSMFDSAKNEKEKQNRNKQEEQIINLGQQIVRSKLYQWQKIDYLQNETAIKLKSKIDNLVIHLRESQAKIIANNFKKNKQVYHQHMKKVVSSFQKSIIQQQRFSLDTPTLAKIKKKMSCATIFEQEGEQKKAEKYILSIIKDAKSNPNFVIQMIEGYLLSIKIYYSNYNFDFANCLESLSLINKKKIEKLQKDMMEKCNQQLKKAEEALNDYEKIKKREIKSRILVQNNQQLHKVLKNTRKTIQCSNIQKNMNIFDNSVLEKRLQINLWKQKFLILQLSKQSKKIKIQIRKLKDQNADDIRKLDEASKVALESFYKQNRGQQLCKIQQTSQSYRIMKESYKLIDKPYQVAQKSELFTKVIFMFTNKQIQNQLISDYQPDFDKFQKDCIVYPHFWRIRLAGYFLMKDRAQKLKNIEEASELLQNYPSNNESVKLKLQIIKSQKNQLSERINFFDASTVSKSYIQRGSYLNKSYKPSKLMRKESKNISTGKYIKKESANEQNKTNQQKISIQIQKIASFSSRFQPLEPATKAKQNIQNESKEEQLPDLRQQSIHSKREDPLDNEDNLSDKYEPYSIIKMEEQFDLTKNLHSQELRSYQDIQYNPNISEELMKDRNRNKHPRRKLKRQSIQIKHKQQAASKKNEELFVSSDRKIETPSTPNIQNNISPNRRYKAIFSVKNRALLHSPSNSSNSSPFKYYERKSSYIRLKRESSDNSERRSYEEIKNQIIRERSGSAQKGTILSTKFAELADRQFQENRHSLGKRQAKLLRQNFKQTSISRKIHTFKNVKQMSQYLKHEHFDKDPFQQ